MQHFTRNDSKHPFTRSDSIVRFIGPIHRLANLMLLSTEKSGKTLHLLKSGSKPIKPRSKRKKVEVLGTLKQFHESKSKPSPKEVA